MDASGTDPDLDREAFLQAADLACAARLAHAEGAPAEDAAADGPLATAWLPLSEPEAALLGTERKLPRRLHLWFAAVLGVMAACAALAQTLLARQHPAAAEAAARTPADGDPPALGKLQQALLPEPFGNLPAMAGIPADVAISAAGGDNATLAGETDPATTLPGELLQLPGLPASPGKHPRTAAAGAGGLADALAPGGGDPAVRLEQEKARSLIAGSRILAISHVTPGLADTAAGLPTSSLPAGGSLLPNFGGGDLANAPALLAAASAWLRQALPTRHVETGDPAAGSAADVPVPGPVPALQVRPAHPGLVVLEGTSIPCVLVNELRSDVPGMILAQVSQDVFDSVQGNERLIPRGTRLVGRYDSQVSAGQQRVLASFHRLILPDGSSIDLSRMEGADGAGGAGLEDQVDTHFWKRFGLSFLTAGIARVGERNAASASSAGGLLPGPDAAGQILLDTARSGLQYGSQLPPTVVIRRGTPFVVMVNHDLQLPALPSPGQP